MTRAGRSTGGKRRGSTIEAAVCRRVCEYPGGALVSPLLLAVRGGHTAVCQVRSPTSLQLEDIAHNPAAVVYS